MPTTHTTPIDLRPYHGREFEGVLKDGSTERKCKGRVSVNKNMGVFCCQNAIDGIEAENKLGYVFSLCVQFEDEVVFNKSTSPPSPSSTRHHQSTRDGIGRTGRRWKVMMTKKE